VQARPLLAPCTGGGARSASAGKPLVQGARAGSSLAQQQGASAEKPLVQGACGVTCLNYIYYLKLTEACQTKANKINNTGIIGKMSTIGEKGA